MNHLFFELRPFQREALLALENPSHVICVAPTGSGKSLIYEKLAQRSEMRVLLVSPLIALARQQRDRLVRSSIPVGLAAGPDPQPPPASSSGVWIVSPERLQSDYTLKLLMKWKPTALVVDECHCLWDWGERFRPAFQLLPLLKSHSIERSLWLTATLPVSARDELKAQLPSPPIEIGSFALPPSLRLSVKRVGWIDRAATLMDWVSSRNDAGIIFVQTRATSLRLMNLLAATGRRCTFYHAGVSTEERRNIEDRIGERQPEIIVATSAFGMGMDHPYLKWALLWQAPPSVLALAQAIGRAGRDPSTPSDALIFWDDEDFQLLEWMCRDSPRQRDELRQVWKFLSSDGCRRAKLSTHFGACDALVGCKQCDFCN